MKLYYEELKLPYDDMEEIRKDPSCVDERLLHFIQKYQRLFPDIDSCWKYSIGQILIVLKDHTTYLYDDLDGRIIRVQLIDKDYELTEEEWRKGFCYRLRDQIFQSELTQSEIAEQIDISQVMLSRYLNEKATPSAYILCKLAIVLECSVSDLVPRDFVPL